MNKRFDQAAKVFALRAAGYSYREIALQMNRTVRWVRKQIEYYTATARDQLDETRDEARQMIVARLHQLIQPHMERKEDPESAKVVLQATKLEADVLGLHEQPIKDQAAREIIRALADQFQMFRRMEPAPRSIEASDLPVIDLQPFGKDERESDGEFDADERDPSAGAPDPGAAFGP